MTKYELLFSALFTSLFMAPALATGNFSSTNANFFAACSMLLIAIAVPLTIGKYSAASGYNFSKIHLGFALLMVVVIAGWQIQGIEFWSTPKTLTYLGALLFYLAFSRFFTHEGETLRLLIKLKLIVLAAVSVYFLFFIYNTSIDSVAELKRSPPLFSHLRHLNYELYFGILLAACGFLSGRKIILSSALLCIFIFLTIWSAGRGSILALTASIAYLMVFSRHLPIWRLTAFMLIFAVVAAVVIFGSEKQYLLVNTIEYSTNVMNANEISSKSALNQFTTGRTAIWQESIGAVISQGPNAILTGLGPDAFRKHQILPGFVHPHNALVQAFMEFGLIGLSACVLILLYFIRLSIRVCSTLRDPALHLAGAMFFGGVVFSMVDGIFHHTSPLAMMVLIMALLHSASHHLVTKSAASKG